jgi:NADH-quinone oxidoreductase subunit C
METPGQIRDRILARFPGAEVSLLPNPAPAGTPSLLLGAARAREIAVFLRDDPALRLDYCSNVTGVDWPDCLEAVYHLCSIGLRHGPLVVRMRTGNRADQASLPSLTPVWRSCEFQEREAFDLFGIVFEGHPDPRRILMWDGFKDHPMRKDYVEPDDYEWEPTAHDEILAKAGAHHAKSPSRAAQPAGGAREGSP